MVGLGSCGNDICGKDWVFGSGGDNGDEGKQYLLSSMVFVSIFFHSEKGKPTKCSGTDLAQAISHLKENGKFQVPPLVVFGHMHKELAYGGHRKMIVVTADKTIYLNGAVVPRVDSYSIEEGGEGGGNSSSSETSSSQPVSRSTKRAFTVIDISDGKVDKITESWISVVGDETCLNEEHLMDKSGH